MGRGRRGLPCAQAPVGTQRCLRAEFGIDGIHVTTPKPMASEADAGAVSTRAPKAKLTPKKALTALKRQSLRAIPGKKALTSGEASKSGTAVSNSASSGAESAATPKGSESKATGSQSAERSAGGGDDE